MGSNVFFSASSVWDYAFMVPPNTEVCIARNSDFGVEIMFSRSSKDSKSICITVYVDDQEEEMREVSSSKECQEEVDNLCDFYLTGMFALGDDSASEAAYDDISMDCIVEERENELDDALMAFLESTLSEDDFTKFIEDNLFDDTFEEIKDDFLIYLAFKRGFKIYRPTVLNRDNGEEYLELFPYSEMESKDFEPPSNVVNPT